MMLLSYWGHVVRCPDKGFGEAGVMIKNSSQAKVTKLDVVLRVEEYVGGFEISVKDFLAALFGDGVTRE